MRTKIHAISVNFPGVVKSLKHGVDLGLWDLTVIGEGPIQIPKADAYILGAWHDCYFQLLNRLPEKSRVAVLWASSAGEMDLEPIEVLSLTRLLEIKRVDCIFFSTHALADSFEKGVYFPYPIHLTVPLCRKAAKKEDIITLFCPPTLKKNIFNQLLAVKAIQKHFKGLGRKMELHTNLKSYEIVMGWLGLDFKMHGWLPENDYFSMLSRAKCNLGVSWAESFNYQVLEAALCNTFSVVSSAVWWYPEKSLVVANPNEPKNISEKILECIEKSESTQITGLLKQTVEMAKKRNADLNRTLKSWLGWRNP